MFLWQCRCCCCCCCCYLNNTNSWFCFRLGFVKEPNSIKNILVNCQQQQQCQPSQQQQQDTKNISIILGMREGEKLMCVCIISLFLSGVLGAKIQAFVTIITTTITK